jgi:hypothetical protein
VCEAERTGRLERVEDRLDLRHVRGVAADHQGVPVGDAPDATGDTDVHVADALRLQPLGPRGVVAEARVATVDDHVALGEQLREGVDGGFGDPGRDHGPHHSRCRKLAHQLLQAGYVTGLLVVVVTHHLVPGGAQTIAHVAAHSAEADKAQLHGCPPQCVVLQPSISGLP